MDIALTVVIIIYYFLLSSVHHESLGKWFCVKSFYVIPLNMQIRGRAADFYFSFISFSYVDKESRINVSVTMGSPGATQAF